jgi:hypothetical protein
LTVNPAGSGTTLVSSTNPSVTGQSVSFTATVTGAAPTGTVSFLDGATPLCSAVALAGAQASCASAALTVGPHSITAVYSGDANNASSTSSAVQQNVAMAATSVSLDAAGPITLGQPSVVTATVAVTAPGAGTPTGTIAISDGAASCSILLPASTCNLTPTSAGTKTISANYSGDAAFVASNTSTSLIVNPLTQTITVTAPGLITIAQGPVTFSATASSGLPVTVTSATPGVCSVSGNGPFTVQALTPGLCTLIASQAGDDNNAPASVNINLQVQLGQATAIPALDPRALLGMLLLFGLIGATRTRRG